MSAPAASGRKAPAPAAGSTQQPWLWQPFAAVVALFLATVAANSLFKPNLEVSSPTLVYRADGCKAEFVAVNHTRHAVSATVRVICRGSNYRSRGFEGARVKLALDPGERRSLSCEVGPREGLARPVVAAADITEFHEQIP